MTQARGGDSLTQYYYLDANPLLRWSESKGSAPEQTNVAIGAGLEQLLLRDDAVVALSEITLVEVHSVICTLWRSEEQGRVQFDDAWADAVLRQLMQWVANGAITVLDSPPRLIEIAMANVESATREQKRSLHAWDAVHICCASDWARRLGTIVTVVTSDRGFNTFLEAFPAFKQVLELMDPASTQPS